MEIIGTAIDHSIYIALYLYLAAFVYNYFVTRISIAHPPPPGKSLSVNGRKQYIAVTGSHKPVVVIEPGIGASSLEWYQVVKDIAKFATVVQYDRAGYGWSDPGPKPRYGKQIAAELRLLLKQNQLKGPFMLVSQAEGVLFAEQFARQYPGDVAGFIAVNPVSKDTSDLATLDVPSFHKAFAQSGSGEKIKVMEALSRFGLMRLWKPFFKKRHLQSGYASFPPAVLNALLETKLFAKTYETQALESEALMQTISDIQTTGTFSKVPVKVVYHASNVAVQSMISQGVTEEDAQKVETLWEKQAKRYLNEESTRNWLVAKSTTYNIPVSEPELIVKAVKDTLEEIR